MLIALDKPMDSSADAKHRPSLLVVDDDPNMLRMLGQMLATQADVSFAASTQEALDLLRTCTPDVILVDFDMPHVTGAELCQSLKRNPSWATIPVIFVTAKLEPRFEVTCFELGAADYLHKPVYAPVLRARVNTQLRMKSMADELRYHARTDALSGCANRRLFDEKLQEEWARMRRSGLPLSLAMIDIDYFKQFNDSYGHQAGDDCLKTVAHLLMRSAARASDLVARYGGEEFVLLLPDTSPAGAMAVADNVLSRMADAALDHVHAPDGQLSVSIGVSTFQPSAGFLARRTDPPPANLPAPSDLLATADKALYAAKRAGRRQARYLRFEISETKSG